MKHWLTILIILSSCLPLKGEVLFTESFDANGVLPTGWTTDNANNWRVQTGYDGNTTPPALSFTWSPRIYDYSNDVQTPDIDVGDNAGVLIEFDFALDFWGASDHTNGMTISYDGGNGWVPVLNYEIGPDAGFVSIERRTESFTADIESGSDLKLKWTAYGTDSYWIDSWIIDNVKIITLPQLTSVTIESANEDPSTAVEGTNIWLNFTADSDLSSDPYVQINGNACTVDNLDGTNWVAYYTVQTTDPDGPLQFTIDFTDANGVDGSTVKQTSNGSSVVVDNSDPPSFTVGGVTTSGGVVEAGTWASTNTEVQLEVNVPQDSAVVNFDYIEGNSLSFDGSNDEVTIPAIASYQVTDALTVETWVKPNSWSDNEGFLNFATDNGGTEAGFGFVFFATGWRFYLKTTTNTIDYANMAETSTPVGQWTHLAATYDGTKIRIYRNGSAIDSTDAMGNVEWSGAPGNVTLGSFTKDGTTKYFDGNMDDVRLWNVVRSAAEIKASKEITLNGDETGLVGYWQIDETSGGTTADYTSNNNTATVSGASWDSGESPIFFQEPIYDNTVIVGSLFQMRAEVDGNGFEPIGPQIPIVIDDVTSGTKTITASAVDFSGVTSYAHGGSGSFSARLFDVAGNYSEGDTSGTTLTIDLIASNPNPVSISSNNTFPHLATDGDILTITMEYDEDVETPNVTVEGNDNASETDLGAEQFSATYTIDGSEPEGSIDFDITTTDYLGNPGTHSGTTNGTSVILDRTAPEVSPVTIISNNADTQWAKVGDSVKLNFSGNEILYETTVTLAASALTLFDTSNVAYNGASECVGGEIITDNLKLWLDANDVDGDGISEGLYEDNIVDGNVPLWADKSGNGADVIEEAGQGTPSLVENHYNGQAALQFNKAEEDMLVHDLGGNKWNATEFSLFIVFQQNNTPENFDSFFSNGDNNNNNYFQITYKTNDGHFKFLSEGEINFEPWDNDLKLYGIIANASGTSTIVDGNVANWANNTNGRQFDKYKINRNRLNFQYNDSYIAEVLLYDRELTESELTKTYKYLGNKYGQTFTNDTTIVYGNKEMAADDPVGPMDISIQYNDCAGNSGVETIETTDGSYVVFDPDPPEAFTVGTVVSTGGNSVTDAWNSTNTGLDVQVPVAANDTTLKNGSIQLWAKVGANAYELFGDAVPITSNDFGTNKTISLSEAQVEAITGYAEEDTIFVKAFMTDRPGNETEGTLSENTLVIDETAPSVMSSHIESNNADSTKAKVDDEITLTFQTSEIIESPSATIASGDATIADLGSFNWSATYTMLETDDEGIIAFTVNELVDARGNPADGFADATDGSEVVFDRTKPVLIQVQLQTNNPWNIYWAKDGDYGRIYANSSEDLLTLVCAFNENTSTDTWYNAHEFELGYTYSNTDTEGIVSYEVVFSDSAGNQGDTVVTSTDNSYIIFDMTTPAGFTVGNMTATGGNVSDGIWNSTNTGVDILVPIDSDSTLDSGRVQMWGKVGNNPFESIGEYVFIESEEVGNIKTMSLIEDSVEALTGFAEDDTLFFKAVIYDIPGNETEGNVSESYLVIDGTPPALDPVSIVSNNDSTSLAKIGDIITITFLASEPLETPDVTIAGQGATVTDLGGNQFQADYTMTENEPEGVVSFTIIYTGQDGNPGEDVIETSDATQVIFDRTIPTFNPVTILSTNADPTWAKVGDTVTVSFTSSESLMDRSGTIADSIATMADGGGNAFTAIWAMVETDLEGSVPFGILGTDWAGNISDTLSSTTDGSDVIFDRTKPFLSSVHFASNNAMNESIAVGGDIATMIFEPNEPITSVSLTVAETNVAVTENAGIYSGEYTVLGTEPSGPLDFSITFNDRAGNVADSVLSTTDGSFVSHDVGPPDLVDISIISSNADSSWAKVGDTITVTFSGTEILANIELTTVGTISSTENPSGLLYNGTYVMQESDPEGVIAFSITYTDLAGQSGPDYNASTNNTEVQFDKTAPVVSPVTLTSDNVYGDSLAALGSVVTLQFSLNEGLRTVTTQIASQDQTVNSSGLDYDASYTFSESDTDGWVSFLIACVDSAGNAPEDIGSTSDGSMVRFDGTPPVINSVSLSSNHPTDASLAGIGDEITLIAVSAESLRTTTIQIAENNPDSQSSVDWTLTSTYTIQGTETEGYIPFTIDMIDRVGNEGIQVDSTTDGSYVFFDMTAPTAFSLDSVYSTGGTVLSGYWNSTNLEMVLDIPISEDDETLIDGTVQPQVRFDGGDFLNIGSSITIESLGVIQVSISRDTFSSTDGFIDDADAEFTAILQDKAGNETIGNTYNTVYHIDETIPELSEITVTSNNELSPNWATIGNTFTLSYTASEGLNEPITLILNDTINTTQSNNATIWVGEHIVSEMDSDGVVSFFITFMDTAGNSGSDMSETTDGSIVKIDRTSPQVLNVLEGRGGEDITYYNEGDSLTLYWDQSDALSGIQDSYYALGTDSNMTDVQGWTNGNTFNYGGWDQLNLTNDTRYFGCAFAQDSAGNYSDTIWGNGIYIDIQIPDTGFIVDGNWIMDVDYTPDSSQLSYRWGNFSDNVGLEYFQLAIGMDGEQTNILPFTNIGFAETDTITGLSLERDILYTTFLKAIDSAGNTSETVETDGIYFDDVFPMVTQILPEVDSSQVVSVLSVDTLNIQFNKLLWDFDISVASSQLGDVNYSLIQTDSAIVIALEDVLPSFDTVTVVVDSAMAYNLLTVSDTLQFFSELWGDLNHDFAIDVQDVIAFNAAWPDVDLAPFDATPPYVIPSPDGEVNLRDLAAFGQMWNWYYQDYEPIPGAIMTMGEPLEAVARVHSLSIQLPEGTTTGQITFSDPSLNQLSIKNVNDFSHHMVLTHYDSSKGIQSTAFSHLQKSSTDKIVFSLKENEKDIFQSSVFYQFFNREGQALSSGFTDLVLDVLPEQFAVHPNFPNPFNAETRLKIDIPENAVLDMKIYDILGREIYHRHLGEIDAGFHEIKWDGKNTNHESVGTGIYFLRLNVGHRTFSQKMLLLK